MKTRLQEKTTVPAINPLDGRRFELLIPENKIERARDLGLSERIDLACRVPDAVIRPDAIFGGVVRLKDRVSYCYASRPRYAYDCNGEQIGPSCAGDFDIYLVEVAVDEESNVGILRWNGWDTSESIYAAYPVGWRERFSLGRVL